MKRYLILSVMVLATVGLLSVNGCILDAIKSITQNIPITTDFNLSGSATSLTKTETFDLNESSTYNTYSDKINTIEFVTAQYRTKSLNQPSMSGTITITVKQSNGTVLFSKVIPGFRPASYTSAPYELTLSQSEIQLVNAYLSILSNRVFTATINFDNITGGTGTYDLNATVDIVFKLTADTD